MSKPEIAKVKYKDGRVEIKAVLKIGNATDDVKEIVLRCGDAPAEGFSKAFEALVTHVRAILELKEDQWDERITVTGVSWSMSDEDVEGATITALVGLDTANSPLVINTPHLPFAQYSPTGEAPLMPDDAQHALTRLKREAEAYLNGKRAQGDLFSEAA